MTKNSKSKPQTIPAGKLREDLRQKAVNLSENLARSVALKTSYDSIPCPEYVNNVQDQYELVNNLLYIQNCRKALEACLSSGFARLKFKNPDGSVTCTWFKRISMGRVVAGNLQL